MRAMVMAAGLGTRLRPLTYEVPKPMVPVANRPVIEHLLMLLRAHGFEQVIANLHWFPETITGRLGDGSELGIELVYRHEPELLGTAGGVRNAGDWLVAEDDTFVVMAGDALTDIDLGALVAAHRANDGLATMAVKRVPNVREYGVVVTGPDGRVEGFQEKPDPAEALSDRANTMVYVLEREIFELFGDQPDPDFAKDVFPALLAADVPFYVHDVDAYWNDVGSIDEYLQGNLDVVDGRVGVEPLGALVEATADPDEPGEHRLPEPRGGLPAGAELDGRVLVGAGVELGEEVRIDGPAVLGAGCRIGARSRIRQSVLLPGAEVPPGGYLVGAIAGAEGALTPRDG
ncbi:MAG: NTP transferase domain-containing protein [Solirubrobacterales bacterium]|nr:NTP transferase domain-containing protein [Solirubrobacterales bacterium]